jgi:hypothetical protein
MMRLKRTRKRWAHKARAVAVDARLSAMAARATDWMDSCCILFTSVATVESVSFDFVRNARPRSSHLCRPGVPNASTIGSKALELTIPTSTVNIPTQMATQMLSWREGIV